MRALILAFAAAGLALACGSGSNDGSGKRGPTQTNLSITTSGNGLVRGAGTDCRSSCTAQVAVGAPMHLVAVPDSGALFVGWSGACSGSGTCDLTMDVDRTVSATFADIPPPPPPGKHRLAVVVQGSGRVTSSPQGIDCSSGTCTAAFDSGTSVTLTATPAAGFNFSGWSSDCSGPSACTVTLSNDATVFANFVAGPPPPPTQVHLTASVTGSGTVTGGGLNCGESAPACDVTVAAGTTVTLTASAAGATRFIGWGGACSGNSNTCQLTLNADTKVTAEFQSEVIALAPNDGTNGGVIALNSTRVFWNRFPSSGSGIWAVPKNGGEATKVASGSATAIVADDAFLYWTDGSNLFSTPVGGGQVAVLATGSQIGNLALDEVGALYWTVASAGTPSSGSVHRMQDRMDFVLANAQNPSGAVAVDASNVYFSEVGSVKRVSRQGGATDVLFSCGGNCFPRALRADSQNVYFRVLVCCYPAPNGEVIALDKKTRATRVLSDGNPPGGFMDDMSLDVNASVVYWSWSGGTRPFGIFRANADGTGFAAVDSSNDMSWAAVRVDDGAVYYRHAGVIIRRLK